MTTRITILCENSVARPGGLIAEHGFAALIETPASTVLFDTGQGFGLLHNAQEIGRNLQKISSVVLSHGHTDHSGGLPALLNHLQRPLGCAHAGVINIIEHLREQSGEERICALIGGTHLGPASEEQFQTTLAMLKRYRIGRIGLSHCTGLNRGAQLFQEFAGRSFFAAAGTVLEFP